jgi:outer membrane protein assembly factor BamB
MSNFGFVPAEGTCYNFRMRHSLYRRGGSAAAVLSLSVLLALQAAADDTAPRVPPPEETPIGRFLGELFRNIEGGERAPAGQQEPEEQPEEDLTQESRIVADAIDERALAGREQQRDLRQALRLLEGGDQDAGVTLLHQLLDAPEDTLLLTPEGDWKSVQQTAEQVILRPGVREAYVERFAVLADEQLQRARQSGDPRDYADVTRRYLPTPAGQQAAQTLARLFGDLGEPVEASWWAARADSSAQGPPGRGSLAQKPDVPQPADDPVLSPPLEQWQQPFGSAAHYGRFAALDPVLLERWSTPIALRPAVADQVQELARDLVDSERACIPAMIPLAVDGRIICRTLRGLSVFDADTGALLWESTEGASVERLLSGEDVPRPGAEASGRSIRPIPPYGGANADAHPLTGLLFRDGVYGHVSSDGEQVFVLEEHASLSYRQPGYFWGQRVQDDPFERDWETNQLVAYDLKTGAVRWRIGGEQLSEPFDPPLAGVLFMGPPVVDGDELFVIGEQDGTLSLHVLDRLNGRPRWSHAISEVGASIDHDLVRRWWPAQPAVGAGVIVCPTTAGWMVAIDRLQRRIRWTYRYIEGRQSKVSSNRSRVASAGPLNTRWLPSAPILTQRHVLFTPSELPDPLYGDQPRLVCLDLLSGQRVWWEPKRQNLYVGAVAANRVLLVGTSAVEARDLATGRRLWETSLEGTADSDVTHSGPAAPAAAGIAASSDGGLPSGRGILAGEEFLLPLQSGQLWGFDIKTGAVTRRISLREDDPPLGNLVSWRGRLISADPLSLRSFEQRSQIAGETAAHSDGSTAPAARLAAAELQYLDGRFREAHQILARLPNEHLDAQQRRHADKLRWETLLQIVRNDPEESDVRFDELADLARTDQQRLTLEQTRADRLLARGDVAAAFGVYWALAGKPQDLMLTEGSTSVHFRRWIAGRLEQLWTAADKADREQFDRQIRSRAGEVAAAAVGADVRWWSQVLRFHPSGDALVRSLIEEAIRNHRRTRSETLLLQLLEEGRDETLRLWALERLVRLMLDGDRQRDAVAVLEQYAPAIDGGEALGTAMLERIPVGSGTAVPLWSDGRWTLTQSAASFNRAMFEPVLAVEPGLPSVNELRLRVEPNLHRLAIAAPDAADEWETPLRAQSHSFYNHTTGVTSVGQLLFVVHRGVLQAIGVADREMLWQREFDVRSAAGGDVRGPSSVRHQELRTADNFLWTSGLPQMRTPAGMLAVWRPGYVAYFGRHSVTLADPLTGETLWTRRGIAPRTMAYGTADMLLLVPPDARDPIALRVTDGSPIDLPGLAALVSSAVCVTDSGMLQLEQRQPFKLLGWGKPHVRVRLVNPRTGEVRLETSFPGETRFAALDDAQLVAVDPDGAVTLIDARNRDVRLLGSVGEEVMEQTQRLFAITEPGLLYLALNGPPRPGAYSRSYQAAPVHGTLAAFDIRGGLLWSEAVEEQNLIADQLPQLPVLLLSSQRSEREGDVTSQKVFLEVRDKQTGGLLLEDSRYITGGNVREMVVDRPRQTIDLNTYKDRLRLKLIAD